MFKAAVYWIHVLLGILVVLLGIGPMFSIAAPDPSQTHHGVVWFSMIVIFITLVVVSAFVQLMIKKVWVLLLSIIGLIAIFILTLQYIYPYVSGLF